VLDPTEPRYAKSDGVSIGYQVVGDGPIDLVYSPGIWSNLDVMWEWPAWERYLRRLASFSRLILFDMRGIGISDRGAEPPTIELQMDDVRAVMDAAGSQSAVVFGGARAGALSMLFAASHPERTRALVLYAPSARTRWAPDWPHGHSDERQDGFRERFAEEMGTGRNLELQAPSHDPAFERWWARFERLCASPSAWRELAEIFDHMDLRYVLDHVRVPTLVLHRVGDQIVDVGQGRAIAERIPDAKFVELRGADHIPFIGDADAIIDEIEEFVTGSRPGVEIDRVLATVLFSDIVNSTGLAAQLGDHQWRQLLDDHDALLLREITRHQGAPIKSTGDGFLASFDGPARAIQCARAMRDGAQALGLSLRIGLHTGECERRGSDLGGLAVHIGARVAEIAASGEILVSGAIPPLVVGSGITFYDRGEHELKGVPGLWRLYQVEPPGAPPP
jgi:class 3 adenylate cyclase/pimeloyl-ACP methyl ester carboxylesterase